ncbi:MAG: class I SAM-dependent methyltransferase [Fibrobacteria bacterium]
MHPQFIIGGTGFPLVDRDISIGGITVNLAMVPYSPAELDRIVGLVGLRERAWPYWLEDWPATYALAEMLNEEADGKMNGKGADAWPGPILDLGCGAGILAAYLKQRFGREPFSCDFNSDACRLAAINAARNGARTGRSKVFCADFRHFPARAVFGLVLGGEMLYTRENQAPILAFLKTRLAPGGMALFADPGRSAAEGFTEAALAAGFKVETRMVRMPERNRNIRVYRLTPGA